MRNPRVDEILSIRVGVLDLYRDTPEPPTALELADTLAFADVLVLHPQDHDEHNGVHDEPMPLLTSMIAGVADC